ncbi:MAG: hypothetical protein B7X93_13535 [Hydrogenophilales bacterium 17-61-9]|nr:MAG: hypothetical protein B7X93_13535 [Hydrogenophilales bacterium 17-61-9]
MAVGGASAHSNGASAFKGKRDAQEMGTDSPMMKFLSEANIPFHADLPSTADGAHLRSNQVIVYESYLQSAHLSSHTLLKNDPLADRRRQLGFILRTAKSYLREEAQRWAESFARQHGLSLADATQRRFAALSPVRTISKHTERMAKKFKTVHINGESKLPLKDIHEACIVAAALRKIRHLG